LKLNDKTIKISGLSMIVLVIGMILVTPVLACPPIPANASASSASFEKMSTDEQKLMGAKALSDKNVSKLNEELINSGYTSENVNITRVTGKTENNQSITNTIVRINYKGVKKDDSAMIAYVSNQFGTGATAAVVKDGNFFMLQNNAVTSKVQVVTTSSTNWKCPLCKQIYKSVCSMAGLYTCAVICDGVVAAIADPIVASFALGLCWQMCNLALTTGICSMSASYTCSSLLHLC
jgi:hypothetical protein